MSDESDEELSKKLTDKVDRFIDKDRKEKEAKEVKKLAAQDKVQRAEARYQEWYAKYKTQSENSANLIWKWYCEFIASKAFEEITSSLKNTCSRELWVSETIECVRPSRWDPSPKHDNFERQVLSINICQSKLFVHNLVKYGRSHEIKGVPDLLEHVEIPVLIEIAKTITDKTIWDIIEIK